MQRPDAGNVASEGTGRLSVVTSSRRAVTEEIGRVGGWVGGRVGLLQPG